MTMGIRRVTFQAYERPGAGPVGTVRESGTHRAWHVHVETGDGRVGLGDIAPWPGFSRSSALIEPTLAKISEELVGTSLPELSILEAWTKRVSTDPVVCHGVELAILDLCGQRTQVPISALFSTDAAREVRSHALVTDCRDAQRAYQSGSQVLKIKVGQDHGSDLERLSTIRAALPNASLRLDVNGAWKPAEAETYMDAFARLRPAVIEQPVAAHEFGALETLAENAPCKIAADESMVLDPERTLQIQSLGEIVVKPMFLGGLCHTASLIAQARDRGFSVCITHALESPIGRMGTLHLAAAMGGDAVHGLGSDSIVDGGRLSPPKGPGLGISL